LFLLLQVFAEIEIHSTDVDVNDILFDEESLDDLTLLEAAKQLEAAEQLEAGIACDSDEINDADLLAVSITIV